MDNITMMNKNNKKNSMIFFNKWIKSRIWMSIEISTEDQQNQA